MTTNDTATVPVASEATEGLKAVVAEAVQSAGSANRRTLDSKGAIAIINKRKTLTPALVGEHITLAIQGNGQFLSKGHRYLVGGAERENAFDRTIYNLQASSSLLMLANKPLFTQALKAESAGDVDKASDLFYEYLNATQLSFSIISNGRNQPMSAGDHITCDVSLVTSTSGVSSLQVNNPRYKAPIVVAPTKFDVSDLIELEPAPAQA